MAKVITYSRKYPAYHVRKGEPTYFVEKFYNSIGVKFFEKLKYLNLDYINSHIKELPAGTDTIKDFHTSLNSSIKDVKNTTIRKGKRFKAGDYFSPRIWGTNINHKSGRSGPYHSQQIILAPDVLIENVWDFKIIGGVFFIDYKKVVDESILHTIANNDGLTRPDLFGWFNYPKDFNGQIISWAKHLTINI